jgi:hypothetical protein
MCQVAFSIFGASTIQQRNQGASFTLSCKQLLKTFSQPPNNALIVVVVVLQGSLHWGGPKLAKI